MTNAKPSNHRGEHYTWSPSDVVVEDAPGVPAEETTKGPDERGAPGDESNGRDRQKRR